MLLFCTVCNPSARARRLEAKEAKLTVDVVATE